MKLPRKPMIVRFFDFEKVAEDIKAAGFKKRTWRVEVQMFNNKLIA